MPPAWDRAKARARNYAFRAWTACAVLGAFVYGFVYLPEWLVWWKRATEGTIHVICQVLPYPWGDRIEATVGNFGLFVQVTVAIVAFRVVVWAMMGVIGGLLGIGRRRRR